MDRPTWRPVHKIAHKNDFTILVAGNQIIPVKNDIPLQIASHHKDIIRAVSFNEDGTLMATGGDDKLVVVWKTSDWSQVGFRYEYLST